MKTYFTIYFKSSALSPLSVPEAAYDQMREDIMARRDMLIEYRDVTFNPKLDVRYIKREQQPDRIADTDYPEISEEQRQNNLKRLAVLREVFFSRGSAPVQEWANPWSADDPRSGMSRDERRAFQKEFFDVLFETHDDEAQAAAYWLPYHRGHRDPRGFDCYGWKQTY